MNRENKTLAFAIGVALLFGQTLEAKGAEDGSKCAEGEANCADDAVVLDTVSVQGSYNDHGSQGSKFGARAKDIPFSMTDYSQELLEEVNVTRVSDVYRYMTGVSRAGRGGYYLTIRGFSSSNNDRNALLLDGLPGVAGRSGSPPSSGIESVELFRGPSSVLNGKAAPGGFVNMISKKPQAEKKTVVDLRGYAYQGAGLSLGDAPGYGVVVDSTGPLDRDGRFLYRLIGEYSDIDSYRNFSTENKFYFSPRMTWLLSENTDLTLALEYFKEKASSDDFLVAPGLDINAVARDIRVRYQDPDDGGVEVSKLANLSLTHTFSEDITLNVKARSLRYDSEENNKSSVAIRPDLLHVSRRHVNPVNSRQFDFIDANTRFKFATGPLQHSLLVGLSGGQEVADFDRRQYALGPAGPSPLSLDVNIYNPIYPDVQLPLTPNTHRRSVIDVRSAYLSNLTTVTDHWKVFTGVRYDRETDNTSELRLATVPIPEKDVSATVPMAGVVYQPTEAWSLYGSYSESFRPPAVTAVDANGVNSFDPESGDQVEVGAKADIAGGLANATFSLFRINREGALIGVGGGVSEQIGAERSEGAELEFNLQIDNWRMLAGYSYTDAYIVSDPIANRLGATLANAPKHGAHIWARYDLPEDSAIPGLGFGLGVIYSSERPGTLPSATTTDVLTLPDYTVADLGIYYSRGSYDLTLSINNLFDKRYFVSAFDVTNVNPGDPRNIAITLRKTF